MSLRARLLLGMAVVAVVLVAASISINRATEHNLVRQLDQRLERSDELLGSVDLDGDGRTRGGPPSAVYVGVIDPSTSRLVTVYSPNESEEASEAMPSLDAAAVTARLGSGPFTVQAREGDTHYRAIVRPARDGQAVVIALPMTDVEDAIHRLVGIQAIASVVILITLGLVTFWVLRLGVRPVKQMTDTAKAIGEGDLSQRIPDAAPGTEAGAGRGPERDARAHRGRARRAGPSSSGSASSSPDASSTSCARRSPPSGATPSSTGWAAWPTTTT
ncbi:MAG: HAMP domain-containing protein [Acidimicrobiales bacterium]